MEEDNAIEMYKAFASPSSINDSDSQNDSNPLEATAIIQWKDVKFKAKIYLKGNLLCCTATDDVQVPLVFVLEKIQTRKIETEDSTFGCEIGVLDEAENIRICFDEDKIREKWMIKMSISSHQMARAELDEIAYKFYTMGSGISSENSSSHLNSNPFLDYYLAAPIKKNHTFALSQSNNLPFRRLAVEETMWESKMSFTVPRELLKLFRRWNLEMCALLESRQMEWPCSSRRCVEQCLRLYRENGEAYEQCIEFIDIYSGPQFRKSTEKYRVAFSPVPTNVHVQIYSVTGEEERTLISSGTASALPLRFQNGGLQRLISALPPELATSETTFVMKRQQLLELKRKIGAISKKLDTEWKAGKNGKIDNFCVGIYSDIKQMHETLLDVERSLPNADAYVEALAQHCHSRMKLGEKISLNICDGVTNQLDALDVMLISLHTKIAALSMDEGSGQNLREEYEKTTKSAMTSCLDMLLLLADSLLEAHLYAYVLTLGQDAANCAAFVHIQLRIEFVLSQTISIASTALLNRIYKGWPSDAESISHDMLLVVFSFLSAYGDERGMAEDAVVAWRVLENRVKFQFVKAPSTVCRNCIPIVKGHPANIEISLPLPHETFENLPESLKSGAQFHVKTAYFNIGVNHEASLGQTFGGIAFESAINLDAAERIRLFANKKQHSTVIEAANELSNTVKQDPSRKNLAIFEWAMKCCELLGGESVICCKSGKDRTGMAVTLEQGRVLKETCALTSSQLSEVVAALRIDGLRRENCKKNVGKPLFSFSTFQMHFLPKNYSIFTLALHSIVSEMNLCKERETGNQKMTDLKFTGEDIWQDREIRFDVDHKMLRLTVGEIQVDRMDNVEDTKGNNGDKGIMRVTNLRLIWHAVSMPRINITIGWSCVTGIQSRMAASTQRKNRLSAPTVADRNGQMPKKTADEFRQLPIRANQQKRIRGTTCEAIFVLAKALSGASTKFEFIFTGTTTAAHSKLFNTIASINRSYETTKLYREIKMRGAIIDDNSNLKLLPLEQMVDKIPGVWNLSSEQGNLGMFVITNCRVVWFAELNTLYNVSIPYLTLFSCRVRESKFGMALVLETTSSSGEYILGFRVDPLEKLHQVCQAIQSMLKSHLHKPIFGVTFHKDKPPSPTEASKAEALDYLEDDVEIEQKQLRTDAFAVGIVYSRKAF
ncbi:hypothetical protein WR25_11832 isoform B [Diploscapter pachys]|uniref:BBSome complex member BBS5 PH domain-containing protein n=1 Tax=Diploscapter pachys TaxID=2018661 RepID=A0A2A2KLS3_9BILA|nr:hypothetical protein WR25_11832 isoform B [Diploscapter pachys]